MALGLTPGSPLYAEPLKRVIISSRTAGLSILPYVISERLGFYREEGLEVQPVVTRGTVSIQTLLAGSAQYTNALPIPAIFQGAPIKILLVYSDKPVHYIVSSPKLTELKQLVGKKIAIASPGGNATLILRDVLEKAGIPMDRVELRSIGEGSVRLAAVLNDVVDAAILPNEETSQAKARGLRVLAYTGDYISVLTTSLATTDARIKSSPSDVYKTVKATLRGQLFMYRNPGEAVKFLMEVMKLTDVNLANDILVELSKFASDTAKKGWASEEDMESNVERVKRQLQLTGVPLKASDVTLDQVYDFSFAKRAYAEIMNEGWNPQKFRYSKQR